MEYAFCGAAERGRIEGEGGIAAARAAAGAAVSRRPAQSCLFLTSPHLTSLIPSVPLSLPDTTSSRTPTTRGLDMAAAGEQFHLHRITTTPPASSRD